jgi:hypothetical protein
MNENDNEEVNKFSYLNGVVTNTAGAGRMYKCGFRRQMQLLFIFIKHGRLRRYLLEQS